MANEASDRALCEIIELQAELLRVAYETEDTTVIDDAIVRVADARRMMKNGLYELIYGDDPEYADDATLPSDRCDVFGQRGCVPNGNDSLQESRASSRSTSQRKV
jgi:hypothetical protein